MEFLVVGSRARLTSGRESLHPAFCSSDVVLSSLFLPELFLLRQINAFVVLDR